MQYAWLRVVLTCTSFGNAIELIVAITALLQSMSISGCCTACSLVAPLLTRLDELRLVQTSLLGSVLSNLLLVLGMSFFAYVRSQIR